MRNINAAALAALMAMGGAAIARADELSVASVAAPAVNPLTSVSKNDEGESLLADSFGRTLYVFDADLGKATSVCTADCAELWPPYLVSPAEAASAAPPLGAIKRANGKIQLAFSGRPLYAYAPDRKVGDDRGDGDGDGVGGAWHYVELK